ncbi:MAG: PAS domain-containing protein [Clostridia bacterium]
MELDLVRVSRLTDYVQKLMAQQNGKELYSLYQDDINNVTPQEVLEILYKQVQQGSSVENILVLLDKIVCVFYHSLNAYSWEKPEQESFLGSLMQENRALLQKLEQIKELLINKDLENRNKKLIGSIRELLQFNDHYLKKENILFPYLEKKADAFHGLAIMWSLHNKTRSLNKKLLELLENKSSQKAINIAIGELFFALRGLVQKEELILFPIAMDLLTEKEWEEMKVQSGEYDFPFISKPEFFVADMGIENKGEAMEISEKYLLQTNTGILDIKQILLIFDALPVDLSFIDENNLVKFFTRPQDRIFPRSPAVIGRDVKNCHPPESVDAVMRIIEAFRTGRKDTAVFWLNVRGKEVLIKYFALRDEQGNYRGTLEVSQDITDIKKLDGEQRLLDWD